MENQNKENKMAASDNNENNSQEPKNSTNAAKTYLYGMCEKEVHENHKAVLCEICNDWFRIGCQSIPVATYTWSNNVELYFL